MLGVERGSDRGRAAPSGIFLHNFLSQALEAQVCVSGVGKGRGGEAAFPKVLERTQDAVEVQRGRGHCVASQAILRCPLSTDSTLLPVSQDPKSHLYATPTVLKVFSHIVFYV